LLKQKKGYEMLKTRISRTASPVVMVFSIILALALPALAGDQVPFKGHADDMATGSYSDAEGIHFTGVATGHATQLGRFSRVGSAVVHPDGTSENTLNWTAANGDQLFSTVVNGILTPTGVTGTYVFTGGTGRFENASGQADFVGVTSDLIHYAVEFSGTISSPGASQK
jgi:hypothetical protein